LCSIELGGPHINRHECRVSGASLGPVDTVRSGIGDWNKLDASRNETIQKALDPFRFIRSKLDEPV
jgi:hypothetical protein